MDLRLRLGLGNRKALIVNIHVRMRTVPLVLRQMQMERHRLVYGSRRRRRDLHAPLIVVLRLTLMLGMRLVRRLRG